MTGIRPRAGTHALFPRVVIPTRNHVMPFDGRLNKVGNRPLTIGDMCDMSVSMSPPKNPPFYLERIRELFMYDEKTGQLFRRESPGSRWREICLQGSDYKTVSINKRQVYAHRFVWFIYYGEWPKNEIDHINGDKRDNRIENLRDVTPRENCRNRPGTVWARLPQPARAQVHASLVPLDLTELFSWPPALFPASLSTSPPLPFNQLARFPVQIIFASGAWWIECGGKFGQRASLADAAEDLAEAVLA